MLGKLLKHEFIATRRTLPLMYVAAAATTALLILNVATGTMSNFVTGMLILSTVAIFVAVGVMTLVMVISRYAKGLHGSEGYLTHTLPATETQQLWAKLISGMFWTIAGAVVLAGLGLLVGYSAAKFNGQSFDISGAFSSLLASFDISSADFWLKTLPLAIINALINTAGLLVILFFSITLANIQPFSKHPAIFSVVFVYAISFAMQLLSLPLMMVFPSMIVFGSTIWKGSITQLTLASLGLNTIVYVGLFIATVQLMKRKLSLR